MPRGGRSAGSVGLESRKRLDTLRTFLSPDRPVTVRYCLYQLASRGLYPSTAKKHYRSLKELCLTARIRGADHEWGLDDACFIDNKRVVEDGGIGYNNLADFQRPPSSDMATSAWRWKPWKFWKSGKLPTGSMLPFANMA
jgi:hypothetical protein